MFEEIENINTRPEPFEFYTASDLWTDEHTSEQMLKYHLNEDIDVSSRNAEFINRSVEWIVSYFRVGVGTKIADFGCGPGQTTKYLKNLGIEISGLDLSEKILEQARTIHPEIHFQKENILELEFENDSIAGAVAFYAIVHFTEEQIGIALREVFRVLQPGGIFLFTYHIGEEAIHIEEFLGKKVDIDFMFYTTDFISSCLKDSGFGKIEIIEREPYPGVEYESRRAYVFATKPAVRKTP